MKTFISLVSILLTFSASCHAADNTFLDYQNYNHGYCPDCNCYPCQCGETHHNPTGENTCPKPDPCSPKPVCATDCGIPLWILGIVIAGLATAAALVVGSNNGKPDPAISAL